MHFFAACSFRHSRRLVTLILCVAAVCLFSWACCPGPLSVALAAENTGNERKFAELVKDFKALIENPREAAKRESWTRMEESFLALRRADPKASLATKAYYQSGRCLEELARNSRKSADAKAAATRFAAVAAAYPKHTWADDALYRKAIVELELLEDKGQAAATLDELVQRFPAGDMVPRAQELRRTLPGKSSVQASVKKNVPVTRSKDDSEKSGRGKSASVSRTKPVSSREPASGTLLRTTLEALTAKTTAFVELDRGASYFYRYVPGNKKKKQPPTFLIDFFGVRPDKKNKLAVAVSKGPVERIWTRDVSDKERFATRLEFELDKECTVTLKPRDDKPVLRLVMERGSATEKQARGNGYVGPEAPELKPGDTLEEAIRIPEKSASVDVGKTSRSREKSRPKAISAARKPNPEKSKDLAEQLGLTVKTIMLDAGHGGKDPGATGNGVVEGDLVLRAVKVLGANLKRRGFTVYYTRSGDSFLKLEERTRIANRQGADLFVSIHVNANHDSGVRGLEAYYLDVAYTANAKRVAARENAVSEKTISDLQGILTDLLLSSKMHESKELAGLVLKNMCARLGRAGYKTKNNGVRSAPFYVLMGAKMPSILIEIGYCTNPAEARLLKNKRYLEFLMDGIAEGIVSYKKALSRYAMK